VSKRIAALAGLLLCTAAAPGQQQQVNDPDFSTKIERPAFTDRHPRIGIDEAHRNFHTREGRYKPFASLMESDGFVTAAAPRFDAASLRGLDILLIANAMGETHEGKIASAFTPEECDAVRDWVRGGGSLLFISDHVPWGDASVALAQRFGVELGRGIVMDMKHADGNPSKLVYSAENGLLGDHAIVRGRNPEERVRRVVAFTGQSLTVPANATALLKIGPDATESFDPQDQLKVAAGEPAGTKIDGRAQGIVMTFGRGRVAIFGEAAMFSAQVASLNGQTFKAGMNVPGNDNRRLALNLMHWLARLID
jgi:hypothetical protein